MAYIADLIVKFRMASVCLFINCEQYYFQTNSLLQISFVNLSAAKFLFQSIRHACLNGSAVGMVLEFNKESPSAMVVDWLSNNLYFIDDTRKRVEVYSIHTQARKVIIWKKLGEPRSITLHPAEG